MVAAKVGFAKTAFKVCTVRPKQPGLAELFIDCSAVPSSSVVKGVCQDAALLVMWPEKSSQKSASSGVAGEQNAP
jgi:hypothetical protein